MNRLLPALLAVVFWAEAAVALDRAHAAEDDIAADHQRIEVERHAAQSRFEERRRDCEARFAVSGCMEEAKRERRDTLARLRREQNALDDRERKARGAERRDEITKREDEQARRRAEASSAPAKAHAPRASSDRSGSMSRETDSAEPTPPHAPTPEDRLPRLGRLGQERSPEEEARSQATFDAAQRAAAAHRRDVEARNARRATEHKPSAPLPLPSGASSP